MLHLPHLLAAALACHPSAPPVVLLVGPTQTYTTIDAALAVAPAGAQLLVDPGVYPAFDITNPVSIAGSSGAFTVQMSALAGGIRVLSTVGTVAIEDVHINFDQASGPAFMLIGCTSDVRLRNIVINTNTDLAGAAARAAIEVHSCVNVILEQVAVDGTVARRGSTIYADGLNDGLSALRVADSNIYLRECVLRGFGAPAGGGYAGDALRVVTNTSSNTVDATLWGDLGSQVLIGGNGGSGRGGNCVHHIGNGTFQAEGCLNHVLSPGAGSTLPGGVYAINNDGGVVGPGIDRMLVFCLDLVAFTTTAPTTVAPGTSVAIAVNDLYPGGPCLLYASIGSAYSGPYPGIHGRALLEATSFALGFGFTPTSFALTLPPDPNLIGMQLTAQALVTSGSGTAVTGLSRPSFLGVR
ncbi:MAG: hypothetical protein IT455_13695 [Planctomycetes bacterium]|nr:hypothetical protein [Planctomycetota bacterium]